MDGVRCWYRDRRIRQVEGVTAWGEGMVELEEKRSRTKPEKYGHCCKEETAERQRRGKIKYDQYPRFRGADKQFPAEVVAHNTVKKGSSCSTQTQKGATGVALHGSPTPLAPLVSEPIHPSFCPRIQRFGWPGLTWSDWSPATRQAD